MTEIVDVVCSLLKAALLCSTGEVRYQRRLLCIELRRARAHFHKQKNGFRSADPVAVAHTVRLYSTSRGQRSAK
eukprot:5275924-Prymnesium_polylepis.1